jgi:serpin B
MVKARAVPVVVALALLAACGSNAAAPPPNPDNHAAMPAGVQLIGADIDHDVNPQVTAEELAALIAGQNQMGTDVYRALAATSGGNLLVSPTSISLDLAMVYAGARGLTAEEMRKALHFDLPADRLPVAMNRFSLDLASRQREKLVLATANKLWAGKGRSFLPPFADTMSRSFGAPIATADFASDPEAARRAINDWAAKQTQDRIKELFPAGTIDANTALVLANAVYLNAEWFFPFNKNLTKDEPFTKLDGTTVSVPTMHFNEYLATAIGDTWRAVEIPYSGNELAMVVIVPNDFKAFEPTLDGAKLSEVFGKLKEGGIHLSLPRFSFRFHTSLNETLSGLGMPSAFGGGADFSGMTEGGGLFLDAVEHEAFIKVDEVGTEAAAATGSAMAMSHGPTIVATRPFVFAIYDKKSDAVVFLGRVLDPSATT